MTRRTYTEAERVTAALLLRHYDTLSEAARQLNIPESTLRRWRSDTTDHQAQMLAAQMMSTAQTLLSSVPHKLEGASLRDVAAMFKTLVDKYHLLMDQPTQIIEQRTPALSTWSDDELAALAAWIHANHTDEA